MIIKSKQSKKSTDTRPKWRKITRGKHYHRDGYEEGPLIVVKQGDILRAEEHELSEVLRTRHFERVYTKEDQFMAEEELKEKEEIQTPILQLIESLEKNKFDIVNTETGEALNEKPLTKKQAQNFISNYE